jgi:hypothetical protein
MGMAESKKAKASRLEKAREKRRLERDHTGDTPEAEAERRKTAATAADYDADAMKKRVGNPSASFFS